MSKQRIIFVIDNTYPNGHASSTRLRQYGKGFSEQGAEVWIIMPQPRITSEQKNINPEGSGTDSNGVVYRCMTGSQKRNRNILIRQLIDFWGKLYTWLFLLCQLRASDVVILYEGKTFWQRMLILCCKLRGVQIGLELNEIPLVEEGDTPAAHKKRVRYCKTIIAHIDFAICISQALVDLIQKYAPGTATIKVPVLCEKPGTPFVPIDTPHPFIFHSGSLSEQKDGICGMMRAFGIAAGMTDQSIDFFLTGTIDGSPHAEELRTIIHEYGIEDRVHFLGFLDTDTLRTYQSRCLCAIINKYDTFQNKYCIPTKLSEYLIFSRPVITTNIGEANAFLHDGLNAIIVPPNNPELIAEKIIYILRHPDEAQAIGERGYQLTQKEFATDYNTERIMEFLHTHHQTKVAEITFSLAPGGAERFVVDLSNELSRNHHVTLLVLKRFASKDMDRSFYKDDVLPEVNIQNLGINDGFSFTSLWRIYRTLRKMKPDIVHLHGENCPKFCILALVLLSRKIKFIQTIHSDITQYSGFFYKILFNTLGRWNRLTFVALSQTNYHDLIKAYPYIKAHCIENGGAPITRSPYFENVQKEVDSYRKDSETKIILHVGRCSPEKNQQLLIRAMDILNQWHVNAQLLIIGPYFDSPKGQYLLEQAPNNVHWLGTKKNIGDYHLCSDIFALSSLYEGMPITLIEASLAGTPLVCTPVCGAVDIIQDGENGRLTKDYTPENYANALKDIIEHHTEYCVRASKNTAQSPYTIEKCAQKYAAIFKNSTP